MKRSYIRLHGGDELYFDRETNDGVWTDAGLIPWDWIAAFYHWSETHNRWFSIPLDERD